MRFLSLAPAGPLFSSRFVSETSQKPARGLEVGAQPGPAAGSVEMGLLLCRPAPAACPSSIPGGDAAWWLPAARRGRCVGACRDAGATRCSE